MVNHGIVFDPLCSRQEKIRIDESQMTQFDPLLHWEDHQVWIRNLWFSINMQSACKSGIKKKLWISAKTWWMLKNHHDSFPTRLYGRCNTEAPLGRHSSTSWSWATASSTPRLPAPSSGGRSWSLSHKRVELMLGFMSGCFQVRSVLCDNWNYFRHFPRCALDIIEVKYRFQGTLYCPKSSKKCDCTLSTFYSP